MKMVEIIKLQPLRKPEADQTAEFYRRMNFDTSNVVFAPAFCARAQEAYAKRVNYNNDVDVA